MLHRGLGPKLELTHNPAWGEHCRKEAIAHAALVDRHLADGRDWLLGGPEPTFSDITLCTTIAFSKFKVIATPLDERFEQLDRYLQRWRGRDSFRDAYRDASANAGTNSRWRGPSLSNEKPTPSCPTQANCSSMPLTCSLITPCSMGILDSGGTSRHRLHPSAR